MVLHLKSLYIIFSMALNVRRNIYYIDLILHLEMKNIFNLAGVRMKVISERSSKTRSLI